MELRYGVKKGQCYKQFFSKCHIYIFLQFLKVNYLCYNAVTLDETEIWNLKPKILQIISTNFGE